MGFEVVSNQLVDLVPCEPVVKFAVSAFRKPYVSAFARHRARLVECPFFACDGEDCRRTVECLANGDGDDQVEKGRRICRSPRGDLADVACRRSLVLLVYVVFDQIGHDVLLAFCPRRDPFLLKGSAVGLSYSVSASGLLVCGTSSACDNRLPVA